VIRHLLATGVAMASALALAGPARAQVAIDAGEADAGGDGLECFRRAASTVYLHHVEDRILDAWALPEDGLANRSVVLRLRIDAEGLLRTYELVSFSDGRLAQSVKRAVMLASPFGPVPGEAACLIGRDILTTFGNPAD
jgi:hypothetical protein